jgi:DNA polymerase V
MAKVIKTTSVTGVYTPVAGAKTATTLYASQPAAGFPAPGDDMVESALDIHDLVVKNPTATFFVRVQGDSMEGAGIFSGDVLVIDRSKEPKNASIVVAAVFGELVVKRVQLARGQLLLVSEQAGYEPIIVDQHEDCFVWGVVVGSVRQFV